MSAPPSVARNARRSRLRKRVQRGDIEGRGEQARFANVDWLQIGEQVDAHGCAVIAAALTARECAAVTQSWQDETLFRSRVVMGRHGFGQGEYRYFRYPLPPLVAELRTALYPPLAEIANRWSASLGLASRYPAAHADYLERCHRDGQTQPTPLMLAYAQGDYNCLHQDLYGDHVFPLQVAFLLAEPVRDFVGGEFVLTEQRPRMQSRVEVVPLERGDGVVFPVRERPVQGTRGTYRVNMRHGVSRIRAGHRTTLGIIFHDAR